MTIDDIDSVYPAIFRLAAERAEPICEVWWDGDRWWVPRCWWHRFFCKKCRKTNVEQRDFHAWLKDAAALAFEESCQPEVAKDSISS